MDDCILCGDPLDLVELYELEMHDPGGRPVCGACREGEEENVLMRHYQLGEFE